MPTPRKPRKPPPEPYQSDDPTQSGAWPPGEAPRSAPVVRRGRDNVTAAGEHIATAPDLELGPSGGRPLTPGEDPDAAPKRRRR